MKLKCTRKSCLYSPAETSELNLDCWPRRERPIKRPQSIIDFSNLTQTDIAMLRSLARRWVQPQKVDELVSDLLFRACKSRKCMCAPQPLPFVRTMMRNAFVDNWRTSPAISQHSSQEIDVHYAAETVSPCDLLITLEESDCLRKAVAALPDEYFQLVQYQLDGFTTKQIALKLSCSTANVRKKLCRARQLIRVHLERSGF